MLYINGVITVIRMPQKGQKTVTIPEKAYDLAKEDAGKKGKSTAGYVTELIYENTEVLAEP